MAGGHRCCSASTLTVVEQSMAWNCTADVLCSCAPVVALSQSNAMSLNSVGCCLQGPQEVGGWGAQALDNL